jgi:hypothetical protein
VNLNSRIVSFIALLGMALAGLSQYRPAWAAGMGLDWWSLPELLDELHRCEEQREQLDRSDQVVIARLVAKSAVIDDLRAGRLTLAQAAASFGRLSVPPQRRTPGCGEYVADDRRGERLCRMVIRWALAENSARTPALRDRLEQELARLLSEDRGTIALPE